MGRIVSPARIDRTIQRALADQSVSAIAAAEGLSRTTVYKILNRADIKFADRPTSNARVALSEERLAQIKYCLEILPFSKADIGRLCDVSATQVSRIEKEFRVTRPKRRPWSALPNDITSRTVMGHMRMYFCPPLMILDDLRPLLKKCLFVYFPNARLRYDAFFWLVSPTELLELSDRPELLRKLLWPYGNVVIDITTNAQLYDFEPPFNLWFLFD